MLSFQRGASIKNNREQVVLEILEESLVNKTEVKERAKAFKAETVPQFLKKGIPPSVCRVKPRASREQMNVTPIRIEEREDLPGY
jgi:hypothetical protein